jgi:hypothetical protein
MARVPVFYSFHFGNDVNRVQLVRNMGVVDGNVPVSANDWEEVKRNGKGAVERWIDNNMKYRRCVVVLVGEETADRPWVQYEIEKAWNDERGLFGVYIHNLKCMLTRAGCRKGRNPFDMFKLRGRPLSEMVPCYDPGINAYATIAANMEAWVQRAIEQRKMAA